MDPVTMMGPVELESGSKLVLEPLCQDILVNVSWFRAASADPRVIIDLDLSACLLDKQGRMLEIVDFNNTVSDDRSVCSSGDTIQETDDGDMSESIFVELRRCSAKVHVIVLLVGSQRPFRDVHVGRIEATFTQLVFSATNSAKAAVVKPWWERSPLRRVELCTCSSHAPYTDGDNVLILARLSRGTPKKGGKQTKSAIPTWTFGGTLSAGNSLMRKELTDHVLRTCDDLFPWLKKEEQFLMHNVDELCSALSSQVLPSLKFYFTSKLGVDAGKGQRRMSKTMANKAPPRTGGAGGAGGGRKGTAVAGGGKAVDNSPQPLGLPLQRFVSVLFGKLVEMMPGLKDLREASNCVALLHELFGQIDINGDEIVDWEEFTSFVIEAGMQEAGGKSLSVDPIDAIDEFYVEYGFDGKFQDKNCSGTRPIRILKTCPELGQVVVVEENSRTFKICDRSCKPLNEHCLDAHIPNAELSSVYIYDIVWLPDKLWMAVTLSDHLVYLLQEVLSSTGHHMYYTCVGMIPSRTLHTKLCWASQVGFLLSVDSSNVMHVWDITNWDYAPEGPGHRDGGTPHPPRTVIEFKPHRDVVMDFIFLKDRGLLATGSLDKTIRFWGIENLRHRGTLVGHNLGVRSLAYANNVLVSCSFEYEAIAWDVTSREELCRLKGHKCPIKDVQMLTTSLAIICCVSIDDKGEVRVWDLSQITPSGYAPCLQTFKVPIADPLGQTRVFCLPYAQQHSFDHWSHMVLGCSKLYHMVPRKIMQDFLPPTGVLYNYPSSQFVATIAKNLVIWDAQTGMFSRKFSDVTDSDITCMAFDLPKARRLFVGTESGGVVVLNYVSSERMLAHAAHDREVTSIAVCSETGCVITTSADASINIIKDDASQLQTLRSVKNAHVGPIACSAYMYRLSVIVTGGAQDSMLCVWDFQSLQLKSRVLGHDRGVTSIRVLEPHPMIASTDHAGTCVIWGVNLSTYELEPLCRLLADSGAAPKIALAAAPAMTDVSVLHVPGGSSESPQTIVAAMENGIILTWSWSDITACSKASDHAVHIGDAACPPFSKSFKPYLKVSKDMQFMPSVAPSSPRLDAIPNVAPKRAWLGHDGLVIKCLCTDEPQGLVTVSIDGFQRVWNVNGDLLGEIRLPNLDEVRRQKRIVEHADWDYWNKLKGTIAPEHQMVAKQLLGVGRRSKRGSLDGLGGGGPGGARNGRRITAFGGSTIDVAELGGGAQQADDGAVDREWQQLHRRSSQAAGGRRAPPAMGSPPANSRLRRRRRSSVPNVANAAAAALRSHVLNQARTSKAAGDAADGRKASKNPLAVLASSSSITSLVDAGAHRRGFNRAFSETSIRGGMREGAFSAEDSRALQTFTKFKERRGAYDRAFPEILPISELRRQKGFHGIAAANAAKRALAEGAGDGMSSRAAAFDFDAMMFGSGDSDDEDNDDSPRSPDTVSGGSRVGSRRSSTVNAPRRGSIDRLMHMMTSAMVEEDLETAAPGDFGGAAGHDATERAAMEMRHIAAKGGFDDEDDGDDAASSRAGSSSNPSSLAASPLPPLGRRQLGGGRAAKEKEELFDISKLRPGVFGPTYTVADVMQFRNNFNYVDVDQSGELDMDEWETFLLRMNQNLSTTDARLLFLHVDKDRDGTIELAELIPIVFSQAVPKQHRIMKQLILSENAKRQAKQVESVTDADLATLFHGFASAGSLQIARLGNALTALSIPPDAVRAWELDREDTKPWLDLPGFIGTARLLMEGQAKALKGD